MKFKKTIVGSGGDQRPVYEFHVGREEIELLVGLLENYQRNGPKGFQWEPDLNRSRNMLKAFDEVLPRKQKRNV